ncbi:hypothetical protein ACL03H_07160 [Saccharopolyspora sp. MS10]|uniref:hypothetical protein n=1 Tax=Saccharopolyspora sp. MS10 TaxID=3385973 RepID=UPI0039A3EBEF
MAVDTHARAQEFAQEVQDLLDNVLPAPEGGHESRQVNCLYTPKGLYAVHPGDLTKMAPIPLLSGGMEVAYLRFRYHCTSDTQRTYLAVEKSAFELIGPSGTDNNAPIVRLDYGRGANKVPSAHWNVHAERGAVSHILARTNPKHSGMLSKVHLSVGGARARPCLEDFLQMLLDEFKFDRCPGAQQEIERGRVKWRRTQIATLVRDAPDVAVETLESLGYGVTVPSAGVRSANFEALRRC